MSKHRIDSVGARDELPVRADPFWHQLAVGRGVGFRSTSRTWIARRLKDERDRTKENPYEYETLGDYSGLPEKDRFFAAKKDAETWFKHRDEGGAVKAGTVADACKARVEHLRAEKSETAAVGAEGYYRRLVYSDPIANIDLAKATKQHFRAWRSRVWKSCGLSGLAQDDPTRPSKLSSFNRSLTPVRAALNFAKDDGKVATDAAWKVALKPEGGAGNRRDGYLDAEARVSLIQYASDETKRYLNTLRLLPLRPGDVAKLRVEHFKPHEKSLRVPQGKTKYRDVPLSADAVEHFKSCAKGKLPKALLICRDDGSQWKRWDWRDQIKLAAAGARLPSATCAYSMRHSVITDLVKGGLDLFTVATVSGTSVLMIERHYGHLQREHARAALDRLAKM